jgi:hypothetical protein
MNLAEFGRQSSRERLPINIYLVFKNHSRTPVPLLIVSSNMYINSMKAFSMVNKIEIKPYNNKTINLNFKRELENAEESIKDILTRDIKLIISYYYAPVSLMNKIAISKVEQKITYLWNTTSTKWIIETQ